MSPQIQSGGLMSPQFQSGGLTSPQFQSGGLSAYSFFPISEWWIQRLVLLLTPPPLFLSYE